VIHYQIGEIILVLTVTGKGVVSSGGKIQMHGCTVVRSAAWGVVCGFGSGRGSIAVDNCTVSQSGEERDYAEVNHGTYVSSMTGVPQGAIQPLAEDYQYY
jgi:hypothetical protein